jgi:Na+-transporting NADH:ubiquinone oxidoreductase subunit D
MGTILGFAIPYFSTHWDKWIIMVMPPGGFFVLAMVLWLCRSIEIKRKS